MLPFYMAFWSVVMIVVIGMWRVRNLAQIIVVIAVTAIVLIMSQSLFIQLSLLAGAYPERVFSDPGHYFSKGPAGWLALLIMPCGWLGPIIGLHLVQKWNHIVQESA